MPSWKKIIISGSDASLASLTATNAVTASAFLKQGGTSNQFLKADGSVDSTAYTSNTGTVTSVGGTGTVSGLTLSGTVTTTGNLTLGGTLSVSSSNFTSQTTNTVLVAPNGSSGVPSFRSLVPADLVVGSGGGTSNFLRADGTWSAPSGVGGGSGDVVGPASSLDGSIVRFDGTTGKLIQGSLIKITDSGSLILPENSNPVASDVGEMKLFSREVSGRLMPAFIGPTGLDSTLQPFLARNKVGYWCPPGNATTVPGVFGFTAPTVTNFTATARNVATTNLFTRMRRLGYVTSAVAGQVGNWRVGVYQITVGSASTGLGGFSYILRFGISDAAFVTGARMFMGVRFSSTPANAEPNTLTNCIGIGHGASDTNMKLYYGGTSAQTPIDLGVNFPSNTNNVDVYELALFSAPTSEDVSYEVTRLNTGHVATGTITNTGAAVLPTNSVLLAPWGYRTNNATALAVGVDIMSAYLETDY